MVVESHPERLASIGVQSAKIFSIGGTTMVWAIMVDESPWTFYSGIFLKLSEMWIIVG